MIRWLPIVLSSILVAATLPACSSISSSGGTNVPALRSLPSANGQGTLNDEPADQPSASSSAASNTTNSRSVTAIVKAPSVCIAGQPNCGHPTPSPTAKPTVAPTIAPSQTALSVSRAESNVSSAAIIITAGTTAVLGFYCVNFQTGQPCTGVNYWQTSSPGGFTTYFSPPTTIGSQPSSEFITVASTVSPGYYILTACISATQTGGGNCKNFYVQVVSSGSTNPTSGGPFAAKILSEAESFYAGRYSTAAGPVCPDSPTLPGSCACAWVLNKILVAAGVAPLGAEPDFVPSLEDDLKAGRGQLIPLSQALPGDIDI